MPAPRTPLPGTNLLVPPTSPCATCWTAARRIETAYGDTFPVSVIAAVVAGCVTDLAGAPRATIPELGERLARHRLDDAVGNGVDGTTTAWVRTGSGLCALLRPPPAPQWSFRRSTA